MECPNLEAVKCLNLSEKQEDGNESQETVFIVVRAQSIKAEPDTKESVVSQCRTSSSQIECTILQMFSSS